jgi:hypothetical protein
LILLFQFFLIGLDDEEGVYFLCFELSLAFGLELEFDLEFVVKVLCIVAVGFF